MKNNDDFDSEVERALAGTDSLTMRGRVNEVRGTLLRVGNIRCSIGEVCELSTHQSGVIGFAEVVGFSGNWTFLSPLDQIAQLSPDVQVKGLGRAHNVQVGAGLLGRVLNGFGQPIDGAGPIQATELASVDRSPVNPILRQPVTRVFNTGFHVIDSLLTCGFGQRMGIFAPPGAGKSMLTAELVSRSPCPVNVIALVGERGREVGDFIRQFMNAKTKQRTVIVAATSDRSAMERVRAAQIATTIVEYFRDQGQDAMLVVDSLTRLARAQREIGLGIGEPPTRRGFPPSVFSMLPKLLERTGTGRKGSITAFYTVLTEGDDDDDPVAEEVKAILDGHLVLSPELAAAGQYPAIDPLRSNSRLVNQVQTPDQLAISSQTRALLARYEEVKLLLQMGEYKPGTNVTTDKAIACHQPIQDLFRQPAGQNERSDLTESLARLSTILADQTEPE